MLLPWHGLHNYFHDSMLENDAERLREIVNLPHEESETDLEDILATNNFQPKAAHTVQPREYGHNHNAEEVEVDRACDAKRTGEHIKNSAPLDTRRKEEERSTQDDMATDNRERTEVPRPQLELGATASPEQTGVAILRCCPTCQQA